MKPNYLFIGASKCATTTLCYLLGQHPDVFMVSPEIHFFAKDEIYAQGFDWYESLFEEAGDVTVRGQSSNLYTMKEIFPEVVSRIIAYAPDIKLIYSVRHPLDRIESYWLERRSHGGEGVHYDFNQAVRLNRDWLVDSSNYWKQINAYRPHVSDDRILIVFYEDFKVNPNVVMRRCFEFLDVDPDISTKESNLHLNPSSGKKIPTNFLSCLRSYPLFRTGVKLIPKSLREPIKRQAFFKKIQEKPQWSPETRDWVVDMLEADTYRLLEYCGKPKEFWRLRASETSKI